MYDYPCQTLQAKALLKALDNEGHLGVVEEVWRIASTERKSAGDPMDKILKDRSGSMIIFDLIFRLPEKALRALINNDICYQTARDADFFKLFPPISKACGVYGNSLYVEGRGGKFLTSKETRKLADNAMLYWSGALNEPLAMKIDQKYGNKEWNAQDSKKTREGHRLWGKGKKWHAHYHRMLIKRALGGQPDSDEPSYQSPIEVGCSKNIAERIQAHSIDGKLQNTTPVWGITVALLKEMGIKIGRVRFAILHIVDYEKEMNLAEILITMLCGALVEQGGYNGYPPGTSSPDIRGLDYTDEIDYIYNHLSFVEEAAAQALKIVDTRRDMIKDLTDRDGSIEAIDKTIEAIRRADAAVKKANKLTTESLDVVLLAKEAVAEEMEVLKKNGEAAEAELEFWRVMKEIENED